MKKILFLLTAYCSLITAQSNAQEKKTFTPADTLRGSITPERGWWDVLRYDITVKPDYETKTTEGFVTITLRAKNNAGRMQVDLQQPLEIDSFSVNGVMQENKDDGLAHSFEATNVWYLSVT